MRVNGWVEVATTEIQYRRSLASDKCCHELIETCFSFKKSVELAATGDESRVPETAVSEGSWPHERSKSLEILAGWMGTCA
jgi:hypothetical protein